MLNYNQQLNLQFDEIQLNVLHQDFHFEKLYQWRNILPVGKVSNDKENIFLMEIYRRSHTSCANLYSIRVLTAVVWVRKTFFCASSSCQSY